MKSIIPILIVICALYVGFAVYSFTNNSLLGMAAFLVYLKLDEIRLASTKG